MEKRRILFVLTVLLLIVSLPMAACADGLPDPLPHVRFVPAPADALEQAAAGGSAAFVLAATPDGRNLLIGGRSDLYIWDTQESKKIPLNFAPDAAVFREAVTQYALNEAAKRGVTGSEMTEQWMADFNARAEAVQVRDGTSGLQLLEQAKELIPAFMLQPYRRGLTDRYAFLDSAFGQIAVNLETGECRLFAEKADFRSLQCDNRIYSRMRNDSALQTVDLATGETARLEINGVLPDEFDLTGVCVGTDNRLWLYGKPLMLPATDEEKANYHLRVADCSASDGAVDIPWPEEYQVFSVGLNCAMITEDGKYILIAAPLYGNGFVIAGTGSGTSIWNSGTIGDREAARIPVGAAGKFFVCYRISDGQLVLLDPETGAETALAFEMASEGLPYSYRSIGADGIRTGEIWTDFSYKMIASAQMNQSGMIFARIPGWYILEP